MNVTTDLKRYVIFAVAVWFTLWVALQAVLRGRKIRAEAPPHSQLRLEFLSSVRSITIFSTVGVGISFLMRAGLCPLADLAGSWGPLWFWVSLVVMIVAHDAYFYWAHRLMHRPAALPRSSTAATTGASTPPPSPPTASTSARRLVMAQLRAGSG